MSLILFWGLSNLLHVCLWVAYIFLTFHVLTAASMKLRIFWDVLPCFLLNIDRRFRGSYCLHHQGEHGPLSPLVCPNFTWTDRFVQNLLSFRRGLFVFLMMEAVRTSETLVYSNGATRSYIPEGSNFGPFLFVGNIRELVSVSTQWVTRDCHAKERRTVVRKLQGENNYFD
jgi:hypothetical protein